MNLWESNLWCFMTTMNLKQSSATKIIQWRFWQSSLAVPRKPGVQSPRPPTICAPQNLISFCSCTSLSQIGVVNLESGLARVISGRICYSATDLSVVTQAGTIWVRWDESRSGGVCFSTDSWTTLTLTVDPCSNKALDAPTSLVAYI